jgi:glyceraldehyde-3-phosphate dehydrogenase/erythrose-4-phosphate dehydrogenase
MRRLTLIGFGAIGRSVYQRLQGHARLQIDTVVVSARSLAATQAAVASGTRVVT